MKLLKIYFEFRFKFLIILMLNEWDVFSKKYKTRLLLQINDTDMGWGKLLSFNYFVIFEKKSAPGHAVVMFYLCFHTENTR